jgi:hypothetical protein
LVDWLVGWLGGSFWLIGLFVLVGWLVMTASYQFN